MSNVSYRFADSVGYGTLPDGTTFLFDADKYVRVRNIKWYRSKSKTGCGVYIINKDGEALHKYLVECPKGYEVDHISLDTLDNRSSNLRVCTHQQNQCNQPLQGNNTSGVSGVSYYPPRKKYRARIKACQHDIHLGYYDSYEEAVQARNVGMEFMFGEYGRYNRVPEAPLWIREKVEAQCKRFEDLLIDKTLSLFSPCSYSYTDVYSVLTV